MKKTILLILALVLIVSLAACGGQEQTLTASIEQAGTTTRMEFKAKKDVVSDISQVTKLDTAALDEQTLLIVENSVSGLEELIAPIVGADYSIKYEGDILVESFIFDLTTADLDELSNNGLLNLDRESDYISISLTEENLKSNGWTIEKSIDD